MSVVNPSNNQVEIDMDSDGEDHQLVGGEVAQDEIIEENIPEIIMGSQKSNEPK